MGGIYNIFIVSKSGGLIYHYDHNVPKCETEKTFSYPLDIKLEMEHKRVAVAFGERDGIRIGHSLLALNGNTVVVVNGKAVLENDQNGRDVFQVCENFGSKKVVKTLLQKLSSKVSCDFTNFFIIHYSFK